MKAEGVSKEHEVELNALIKKVSQDYENLKLNTATAACMTFIKKIREDGFITKDELKAFLIVLNPLAPHVTSEVFERVFGKNILSEKWPEFDERKTTRDEIEIPVQVNGKLRTTIMVSKTISQTDIVEKIIAENKLAIDFKAVKKTIYVPGRIVNFIV